MCADGPEVSRSGRAVRRRSLAIVAASVSGSAGGAACGVDGAIPATTRVDHMRQNMGAATGRLPDPALRQRMIRYVEGL